MPDFQQLESMLAQDLMASVGEAADTPVRILVDALVNAIPYYGDLAFKKLQRDTLSNVLAFNLPVAVISPQPHEFHSLDYYTYTYNGPYAGYRDVFYPGVKLSFEATCVAIMVKAVNPGLDDAWWGRYGVAILTDAIRRKVNIPMNTTKLAVDMQIFTDSFKPAFSASYCAVFRYAYPPVKAVLSDIDTQRLLPDAMEVLTMAIASGQFTANVNYVLSQGGDDAVAATWFLYNLWMALTALGIMDMDPVIRSYQDMGLMVPPQIGPGQWWSGGYTSWFEPLNGSDVEAMADAGITAGFPEIENQTHGRFAPTHKQIVVSNGYSQSFCYWGGLNWYH